MNFTRLPQIVQQQITDNICERNHPRDGQNFALTSKNSYQMYKRRNCERKIIQQLPLMVGPDIYLYLTEMEDLNTEDEVLAYLSTLCVTDQVLLEYCSQQPNSVEVLQRVMPHLTRAVKYAKVVHIYITVEISEENGREFAKFLRSMEGAEKYHFALISATDGPVASTTALVQALPRVNSINFNGNLSFTDETWDILAEKSSREVPIESINLPPTSTFTLQAMERFLLRAHLAPKVNIRITEDNIANKIFEYKSMLYRIGRPRNSMKTCVSFDIKNSTVMVHFRATYSYTFPSCERPFARAYDPTNPHPCDPRNPPGKPMTQLFTGARIPRFFHP